MLSPSRRGSAVNFVGTGISALGCIWAQWLTLPGISLVGVTVDWSLIWVVCWSFERSFLSSVAAGLIMGLVLDGFTSGFPSHIPGLILAGVITSGLKGYRLLQSDTLAIALLTFGMAVLQETSLALQNILWSAFDPKLIWAYHQRVSLASGLVSCLWAPLVWWILQSWWGQNKISS